MKFVFCLFLFSVTIVFAQGRKAAPDEPPVQTTEFSADQKTLANFTGLTATAIVTFERDFYAHDTKISVGNLICKIKPVESTKLDAEAKTKNIIVSHGSKWTIKKREGNSRSHDDYEGQWLLKNLKTNSELLLNCDPTGAVVSKCEMLALERYKGHNAHYHQDCRSKVWPQLRKIKMSDFIAQLKKANIKIEKIVYTTVTEETVVVPSGRKLKTIKQETGR